MLSARQHGPRISAANDVAARCNILCYSMLFEVNIIVMSVDMPVGNRYLKKAQFNGRYRARALLLLFVFSCDLTICSRVLRHLRLIRRTKFGIRNLFEQTLNA